MDKNQLIDALNYDLAHEYQAIISYVHWASRTNGPHRPQIRALFQGEVADEQLHAQFLADKIVALGGVPTTQPAQTPTTHSNREMVEAALAAEYEAIRGYTERAQQAEQIGDVGLKVQLENMVSDETNHAQELKLLLDGWTETS